MDCDIRLSHPALSCLRHSHFELGGYEGDQVGRMSEANEPRSGRKSPRECSARACISSASSSMARRRTSVRTTSPAPECARRARRSEISRTAS